jgi:hypothetical protein
MMDTLLSLKPQVDHMTTKIRIRPAAAFLAVALMIAAPISAAPAFADQYGG